MAWWREARYGLFIHWGIYAAPAHGEWYMNKSKVPVAEYEKYAKSFYPWKFNAEEWVKIAQDAGMKYIVFTAKHHDGFSMFGSKVTEYNIVDRTPFKTDAVRELSSAARKAGIKFGIYYSQGQDWYHPGGGKSGGQWDPKQAGDEEAFVNSIVIPQIHELLNDYGKIDLFWWDSSVSVWSPKHP
jgi:alpha-L-fucosidase